MKRAGILFFVLLFASSMFVSAENEPQFKNELNMAIDILKMHRTFSVNDTSKQQVEQTYQFVAPTPVDDPEPREIKAYPNPCMYSMKVTGINPGDELIVYNSVGQVVFTKIAEYSEETIDVSGFDPGIYVLAIINSKEIDKIDFIK